MAEQCTAAAAIAKSGSSSSDEQAYNEWYANLQTYKAFAVRAAQDSAKTIAYTLFHDDADYTNGTDGFRLETWLKDQTRGVVAHPNAVRYFPVQPGRQAGQPDPGADHRGGGDRQVLQEV